MAQDAGVDSVFSVPTVRSVMFTRRYQSILVWLVLATQAVAALGSPVGLLVCRQADGSSHIEWVNPECVTDRGAARESVSDSIHEPCSTEICVDEPIGLDQAVTRLSSRDQLPAAAELPCVDRPRVVLLDLADSGHGLVSLQWVDPGPPLQCTLVISATVLNL